MPVPTAAALRCSARPARLVSCRSARSESRGRFRTRGRTERSAVPPSRRRYRPAGAGSRTTHRTSRTLGCRSRSSRSALGPPRLVRGPDPATSCRPGGRRPRPPTRATAARAGRSYRRLGSPLGAHRSDGATGGLAGRWLRSGVRATVTPRNCRSATSPATEQLPNGRRRATAACDGSPLYGARSRSTSLCLACSAKTVAPFSSNCSMAPFRHVRASSSSPRRW